MKTAFNWYSELLTEPPKEQYCQTRDVFEGRLSKLPMFAQTAASITPNESYLMAAVIGELGANCYDHNLGHWRHEPGLLFGYTTNSKQILIWICDRGRGVHESLSAVHDNIGNPQEALELAFQRKISGRFPEQRGNGLKFVRQVINCEQQRGLWCSSGLASLSFGKKASEATSLALSLQKLPNLGGTMTLVLWCGG
ncbi:MAG: hypothetical protein NTV34_06065 [Proteobacteria bacterium]|nr:hypothetical protein [Pseudomonadota bacterium]